jgi:membrane associated rhomboid family serine protease
VRLKNLDGKPEAMGVTPNQMAIRQCFLAGTAFHRKMRVAKPYQHDYFSAIMALADRTYMRDAPSGRNWSPTVVILVINIAVFFVEYANGRQSHRAFMEYGAVSLEGLKRGFLWQLFTYQFLHGGLPHLVLNSMALYFFGRPMELMLGQRAFLKLYLLSGLAGGIFQVALGLISPQFGGPMVGASAGICGLIAAFALLSPDSVIYLFFVLPVRARYFLPLMIVLSTVLLFAPGNTNIAHGAHLGGTLFGVAYLRWFVVSGYFAEIWHRLRGSRAARPIVKVRFPGNPPWKREKTARTDDPASGDFISREVDPILEKISAHGIHSLTERERRILEAARSRMDKR